MSFNSAHVFKTLQLIEKEGTTSRNLLIHELGLGEGSIKTLIKHLKMESMITTTNKGTKMSEKGRKMLQEISQYICGEAALPKCSISVGEYNYVILLRSLKTAIKYGLEQRDMAIRVGAKGATTLIYDNGKFLMAGSRFDALKEEPIIEEYLKKNLKPMNDDIILIVSDDHNYISAELASKAVSLYTIEKHDNNQE